MPPPDGDGRARRRADEQAGALVLIGGACAPHGEAFGAFLDLCEGRRGGRIVALTTASGDPEASAHVWLHDFQEAGARNVEIPIVDRRARAQDARIADLVRGAQGIFLGGGDQVHLVATLGGSRLERALREAYADGAVIGGTSAGAAALTETILAGGEHDGAGELADMYIGPGFGLLGFRAVIDTHFAERRRLHRLFVAIANNPDLLGLGIDEDTALVVRGHLATVHGSGGVTFVDGRGVRFDNADEVKRCGAGLTLSYLRVGIVGAGYEFNLRERELQTLVDARETAETTPTVRGADVR
ncbi:MAG TPA: cyanophycinase [Gemmatimonadaceae bacterium]|nr:cyanophycinase [Gemmatimonadaceae bacterium]